MRPDRAFDPLMVEDWFWILDPMSEGQRRWEVSEVERGRGLLFVLDGQVLSTTTRHNVTKGEVSGAR